MQPPPCRPPSAGPPPAGRRPPEYVIELWVSPQLTARAQRQAAPPAGLWQLGLRDPDPEPDPEPEAEP